MVPRLAAGLRLAALAVALGAAAAAAGVEGGASSGEAEWNHAALEAALGYAAGQRSSAVVIVDHGRVIAERYWRVEGGEGSAYAPLLWGRTEAGAPIEDVASLQKSLVSVLVGIAADRRLLELDAPVTSYLGAGWTSADGDQEMAITVRHLLSMTSGLSPALGYQAPAGRVWQYNTRAYSRLIDVLERVTGEGIGTLTKRWLTDPTGMRDTAWRQRRWVTAGMDANPIGLSTTARDLARFGELMLSGGVWDGRRLVSEAYVAAAVEPSQDLNPAYGLLWWLNGRPLRSGPEAAGHQSLAPAAPGDMVAAQGALGRKLYVVPSLELVVVRLGDEPEEGFNGRFWELLMAAAPAAPICRTCSAPVADLASRARAADGSSITWVEHVIDDPGHGAPDLAGGDGLAMADLDGDGFDDIVSVYEADTVYDGTPSGMVRVAWGSGDPGRWEIGTLAAGAEAAAAEDVTLADFDRDGDVDVLAACELAHLIYFENPGRGARAVEWRRGIIPITTERGSYIRAFAADLDGDGRPEVAAANKGEQNPDLDTARPGNLSLYLAPADPLEVGLWREQLLGHVRIPINCEPVDLDGDGDLDIVGGSMGESRVLWYENLGGLEFVEHPIVLDRGPGDLTVVGFNMDYADVDGDGRRDIVSVAWPSSIVVLHRPVHPDEPWRWSLLGSAAPDQLVSVRLGDIDGDGDLDAFSGAYSRGPRERDGPLVTAEEPLGLIAWFENPGDGGFPWSRHDISRRKRGMYDGWILRDLDRDGDLDAVGTRGNSAPYDGLIWIEQRRQAEARPAFVSARAIDSQEMPAPSPPP
ncbi:MAG TPA: FG-GAP-like repeat-containing protein [Thermoanaerobaculales bacterium]|nr:FG-GAP-like repeat-containing protein [Thermoanaerobaculales bacterium]HPA81209.1 FG-GAP-like repeat-containing protein [Thermoanaerobaculales bacterium]HQL30609.1 FG-GAP-like repeat-containing protein [Thermoanaerobaculales bacterium]HQP43887.1 FG-GAP-like repeat-containing protein [Thermoanaerobaculales bacterium]